jgi:hypothetical protein
VTDRINQQLQQLRAEQARLTALAGRDDVQLMAMRAGQLSPQRRRLVMELLNVVYREEQAAGRDTGPKGCR